MHKRWLPTVCLLALLAALTGCGSTAQPQESATAAEQTTVSAETTQAQGDIAEPGARPAQTQTQTQPSAAQTQAQQSTDPAAESSFGPMFQKFVRDPVADGTYTIRFKQAGMSIVTTVDGRDSVLESNASGILHFTLINKDGKYYMLMHNTEKYAEMSAEAYAEQADSLQTASFDLDKLEYQKSGEATVSGKKYSTETYDEGERGVVTYYFDDTGLRRARVVKDGKTSEIDTFEVSDKADAAAFEVPSGYTLVEDPAQLLT